MSLGKSLRDFRKSRGLNQTEFGQIAGGVTASAVSQWESGENEPSIRAIELLAKHFNVLKSEILGEYLKQADLPNGAIRAKMAKGVWIPVYGSISAGTPMEIIPYECKAEAPETILKKHPKAFWFKVNGDSMDKEVLDGSFVMIDPECNVSSGDTIVVIVNGFDAALKKYFETQNNIILSPNSNNPEHEDIIIDKSSFDADAVVIIGKKIWAIEYYPDMIRYDLEESA